MKKIGFIGITLMLALFWSSCKKPVPGCTDPDAENYSAEAEKNDFTCSYRGSAVFYCNEESSTNLVAAGVTTVKLYVDDHIWDLKPATNYFTSEPDCEDPDALNMSNYGIGQFTSYDFNYKLKDQDGFVLKTGTFTIYGNQCTAVEFSY